MAPGYVTKHVCRFYPKYIFIFGLGGLTLWGIKK